MASSAPLIDPRDGDDIAQQVRALLAVYAPCVARL